MEVKLTYLKTISHFIGRPCPWLFEKVTFNWWIWRKMLFQRFFGGFYMDHMIWFLVFCWKLIEIWIEIKGFLDLKMIKHMISMKRFSFKLIFFLFAATYWSLIYSRDFLKRKRRNNYAFVQTLLYKIRTEFTNINFIQCR